MRRSVFIEMLRGGVLTQGCSPGALLFAAPAQLNEAPEREYFTAWLKVML
jgi:hypothetical protein